MIKVRNIYYMLSYAFRCLHEGSFLKLSSEEFEHIEDLFAEIITIGISKQLKQGLLRNYETKIEITPSPHGKIDVSQTIKGAHFLNKKVVCTFDDYSLNSEFNRIIKTTSDLLIRNKNVDTARKQKLSRLMLYFHEVESIDLKIVDWNHSFNRNNQTYRMLIYVCHWVYRKHLSSTLAGQKNIRKFDDDQELSRLYEKFIYNFYVKEFTQRDYPELSVSACHIKWQLDENSEAGMLPNMKTDITLQYGNRIHIIDAKYYGHELQSHFNTQTIHSANLYQIFTYVKNKAWEEGENSANVSGMLLYAKSDEISLNKCYSMSGNKISVKNIDLNCDFECIKKDLSDIAHGVIQTEFE